MTGVSITVDDQEVRAALRHLRDRIGDLTPAMRAIGGALQTDVDFGFRAGRDPWGFPWEPLSALTLARRRRGRGVGGNSALRDTGILANSFNVRASSKEVSIGTATKYAGTHQFGAAKGSFGVKTSTHQVRDHSRKGRPVRAHSRTITQALPWGNIPRRAMLPITADGNAELPVAWREEILEILTRHLYGGR